MVCLGTGYIAATDWAVQFVEGTTLEVWTIGVLNFFLYFKNIKYDITNAVSKVSITKYSANYDTLVEYLNINSGNIPS